MTTFDEKYDFTAKTKRNLAILLVAGVVLLVAGIFTTQGGGHEAAGEHAGVAAAHDLVASTTMVSEGAAETGAAHHETATWLKRLIADLWINNMFFVGLGIIGVFFFAIQYASQSAWSTGMLRVSMAIGNWLPIAFVLILGVFWFGKHDLFHWTHEYLYDPNSPQYDPIIAGKQAYLNMPFYLARMVVFLVVWYMFFMYMKKHALAEDLEGGVDHWKKIRSASAWFLVFFAVSSSMAAWDWVMSIDTHWFSTMFGWYTFSSWWVSGLAMITLLVIYLKEKGYLSIVNANHLHDIGKFIFGFSIFWTYLWFSQFLLIYYANIPEETVYFV
ncbi:MAG TPA: quinol:cytochrome C oxidoreductase, partial [Flammeovirgaceae bacterium]|nr:quinol:cytochrome C oxidoreductase [Flammeovirgaceae bacterium]